MYHSDPYSPSGVHFDTPSAHPAQLPSMTRVTATYVDEYRPRSQSAGTRRHSFVQRRVFSDNQGDDMVFMPAPQYEPEGYEEYGILRRPAPAVSSYGDTPTLKRLANTVQFPSTYRDRAEEQHTPQFNSAAHNFTQHLRERSPSSSSALLNLLSRYPSAKQSVYSSTAGATAQQQKRIYRFDERPVDTRSYRPSDAGPSYPLVELSVPKQQPPQQQHQHQQPHPHPHQPLQQTLQPQPSVYLNAATTAVYAHRTQSLPLNGQAAAAAAPGAAAAHFARENPLSVSVYSDFSHSPTFSHSSDGGGDKSLRYAATTTTPTTNGFATPRPNSAAKEFDNRSEQELCTDLRYNHAPTAHNKHWEELLDVTQLDSLLASVLEDNMNRSTSEWSNSFAQVQSR